jgi:AcrR family transcriptional regulator
MNARFFPDFDQGLDTVRGRKQGRLSPKKMPIQARSRRTYDSLLEATARLLVKRGYAALTTNHVAETAGVAIGSLYEYFGTKEVLVAEVVRRTVREIALEVAGSFRQALEAGMEGSLAPLVSALFSAIEVRGKLVRVLWTEVPFLWQVEEIRGMPGLMLAIAREGISDATSPWLLEDPEAATYLLSVMVRSAIVESVVLRPEHLDLAQLQRSLIQLLGEILLSREYARG